MREPSVHETAWADRTEADAATGQCTDAEKVDPALRLKMGSDFRIIMWGMFSQRWYMDHWLAGDYTNRRPVALPVAADFLRCFAPNGALWMVRE